jgi:signal transduction histidine kinase
MADDQFEWLPGGARQHICRLLRAVAPMTERLEARMAARLRRQGYGAEQVRGLLALTAAGGARAGSVEAFFEEAERSGRSLADWEIAPDRAALALREFDGLLEGELGRSHQPAREQLQTGTIFALYRGFCKVLAGKARQAEEQERRRIGRELHDEAGQSLLLLRLELEMLEREAPPPLRPRLRQARRALEGTIGELRRIVAALGPAVLERLGLRAAIRQLAGRFRKGYPAAIGVRLGAAAVVLPAEAQEVIYRVAQEALQNVAKHSRATRVNLSLQAADKRIRLRVSDNGAGFSAESAARQPLSYGLAGMRERAELLGGTLGIRSSPGKGTVVMLGLPVSAGKRSWPRFVS